MRVLENARMVLRYGQFCQENEFAGEIHRTGIAFLHGLTKLRSIRVLSIREGETQNRSSTATPSLGLVFNPAVVMKEKD